MNESPSGSLSPAAGEFPPKGRQVGNGPSRVEAELPRYLPQMGKMSEQLKQTSKQIEDSVVGVCDSFQGIALRAQATVARATGFLGNDGESPFDRKSFE